MPPFSAIRPSANGHLVSGSPRVRGKGIAAVVFDYRQIDPLLKAGKLPL
jgi:hypothetical protein